jgi:hypothetical protein
MRNAIHSEAVVLTAERSQLSVQRLPPFTLATYPEPKMEKLEPPGARSVSDLGQLTPRGKTRLCRELAPNAGRFGPSAVATVSLLQQRPGTCRPAMTGRHRSADQRG